MQDHIANRDARDHDCDVLVIGGGPAGLMAAEAALSAGARVLIADAMPSLGRKFLMAGKSGLNLTKAEALPEFLPHYGAAQDWLAPIVSVFGPDDVCAWAEGLGQPLFIGSSGRVFPKAMKASPLLRAWLARLGSAGLAVRTRWHWRGWQDDATVFTTAEGEVVLRPKATVLALGGASWPRLGSTGAWAESLASNAVPLAPFQPANMGFAMDWTAHMTPYFGCPIKALALEAGPLSARGEMVVTARGLEGGGLYAVSRAVREGAVLRLDMAPDLSMQNVADRLRKAGQKRSLTGRLKRAFGWDAAKIALFYECKGHQQADLVETIKSLAVPLGPPLPKAEAISTAGGVSARAFDDTLMLQARRGVFVCGEMLDWEAPTGGYLLTACFATGRHAGAHAAQFSAASR